MRERLALVFLVALRMCIGWHFLVEGFEKEQSINIGVAEINKKPPFSCEKYFQEGTGPVAKLVRRRIGDTDDLALARMSVRGDAANPQMPAALEQDWDAYFARFANHYKLNAEQQERAKAALQKEKDETALWFVIRPGTVAWALSGLWNDIDRGVFTGTYPGGTYEVNLTVAERVEEYRRKVQEYRGLLEDRRYSLGRDVDKTPRTAVRGEVTALRTELQKLVEGRTEKMRKALSAAAQLADEQKSLGAVPDPPKHWLIRFLDFTTPWLLIVVGFGLLLGLFSRTSAILGALFLLMTILTWPSLPWLPAPPNSEGTYLVISKNVIEMLALLMLTCIPSGRWFGIDALIHALNPWRKKTEVQ